MLEKRNYQTLDGMFKFAATVLNRSVEHESSDPDVRVDKRCSGIVTNVTKELQR